MPFCPIEVEPSPVARKTDESLTDEFQFEDFTQVTAFTIVQAIRQLSSLTKEASTVFDTTLKSIQDFAKRTSLLEPRLREIELEVSKLNKKRTKVGRSSLKKQHVQNFDWKFYGPLSENFFTPENRPLAVERFRTKHAESLVVHLNRYQNYLKSQLSTGSAWGSFESLNSQTSQGSVSSSSGSKYIKNTKSKRPASLNRFSFRRKHQSQDSLKQNSGDDKSPVSLSKFPHFSRPSSCDVINSEDSASSSSDNRHGDDSIGSIHSRESSQQLVEYELRAQQFLHPDPTGGRPSSLLFLPNQQPVSSCSELDSQWPNSNQKGLKDRPLSLYEGQQPTERVERTSQNAQIPGTDQASRQVESLLDNLPVLKEEEEEVVISTEVNDLIEEISRTDDEAFVIGSVSENGSANHSSASDIEDADQSDGMGVAKSAIRKSLDLLPSRWDQSRRRPSVSKEKARPPEEPNEIERSTSFVARSRKWATKKLMSASGSHSHDPGKQQKPVEKSNGKISNGSVWTGYNQASVTPIVVSLDLETPVKMKPDLVAAQLESGDYMGHLQNPGVEHRRASFQCFDDSRFMSLPRANHLKLYEYANLEALVVNPKVQQTSSGTAGERSRPGQSIAEKEGNESTEGRVASLDGLSAGSASKMAQAPDGWPDAFYVNNASDNQEQVSIFNSDITIANEESSLHTGSMSANGSASAASDYTNTGTLTPRNSCELSSGSKNNAEQKLELNNKDEDTISNNSTLVDEDEDVLPLDESPDSGIASSLSSNIPSSSSVGSSSGQEAVIRPSTESEFHSDPMMSTRIQLNHPPLFTQMSDPSNQGLHPNGNVPHLQYPYIHMANYVNHEPVHLSKPTFPVPGAAFSHPFNQTLEKPITPFQPQLTNPLPPQQPPPLIPVSTFVGGSKSKKSSSKKIQWTDILWRPKGSSGSEKSQKTRFANLNPSSDKVTSRTRSANATLSFFRKKQKPEKQGGLGSNETSESISPDSNHLDYMQPIPSTQQRQNDGPKVAGAYINLDGATRAAGSLRANQSMDSIESNYNTSCISSIYATDESSASSTTDQQSMYELGGNYVNSEARIPGTEYYNGLPLTMRTGMPLEEMELENHTLKDDGLRNRVDSQGNDSVVSENSVTINSSGDEQQVDSQFISKLSAEEFIKSQLDSSDLESTGESSVANGVGFKAENVNNDESSSVTKLKGSSEGARSKRGKIYFNEEVSAHSVESIYNECRRVDVNVDVTEKDRERMEKMRSVIKDTLQKKPERSILRRSATSRNPARDHMLTHSSSFEYGYTRNSFTDSISSNDSSGGIPFIDDDKGSQLSIYEENSFTGGTLDPKWAAAFQQGMGQASRAVFDDDGDLDLIDDDEYSDSGSETEEEEDANGETGSVVYHSSSVPASSTNKIVSC